MEHDRIFEEIERFRDEMVELQIELTRIPALSPKNGGEGEVRKAELVKGLITTLKPDELLEYRAPDPEAPCGYRPNLVARFQGQDHTRTVWVMTHLDVVPPGPREFWLADPFEPVVKGGRIYGRGVEDNQQEMVASLYALKALQKLGVQPAYDIGLCLVADEETGSEYGLQYLLKEYPGFRPGDLIVVADGGNSQGTLIEVAEKSILWFRVKVLGRQAHASRPQQGVNAHRIGARLLTRLDELLHSRYPDRDEGFEPPISTFEPTKKEANVPNINTVPGQDVYYFDCRVLPGYPLEEVLSLVRAEAAKAAQESGAEVEIEPVQFAQAAPPTPGDAQVVRALKRAILAVYGVEAQPRGIGGGTVAAFFRRKGFEAAVWSKVDETAHQPNEYCVIENMVNDAKVYAYLFTQGV